MKKFLMAVIAFSVLGMAAMPTCADDTHESHHPKADAQKSYTVKGDVVSVDQSAGKVKVKHEAVPELDWQSMTMFSRLLTKGWRSSRIPVREGQGRCAANYADQVREIKDWCRPRGSRLA